MVPLYFSYDIIMKNLQSAVHRLSKYTSKDFWNVCLLINSFFVFIIVLASSFELMINKRGGKKQADNNFYKK